MTEPRSTTVKIAMPLIAISCLIVAVAWMAGLFTEKVQPGLNPVNTPLPDTALEARYTEVDVFEMAPASLEAKLSTLISSRLLAKITAIHVRAGDTVKAGQVLIELEKSDLQAAYQRAQQQIKAVSARLLEAEKNHLRIQKLRDQGMVPVAELDSAKARLDALSAELSAARQASQEASSAVAYSTIRSPIDGRIVDRFAEPGSIAHPGVKLLALYNPNSIRVEVAVREQLALNIAIGQNIQVEIPSLNKTVTATVEERVPAAQPGSRSFLIKARLEQDGSLLPGMYARLWIPTHRQQQLMLPSDRIVQLGQLNLIWVWQDGQAYRRFVRVGKTSPDGHSHILAGLEPGDQVLLPPPSLD